MKVKLPRKVTEDEQCLRNNTQVRSRSSPLMYTYTHTQTCIHRHAYTYRRKKKWRKIVSKDPTNFDYAMNDDEYMYYSQFPIKWSFVQVHPSKSSAWSTSLSFVFYFPIDGNGLKAFLSSFCLLRRVCFLPLSPKTTEVSCHVVTYFINKLTFHVMFYLPQKNVLT